MNGKLNINGRITPMGDTQLHSVCVRERERELLEIVLV